MRCESVCRLLTGESGSQGVTLAHCQTLHLAAYLVVSTIAGRQGSAHSIGHSYRRALLSQCWCCRSNALNVFLPILTVSSLIYQRPWYVLSCLFMESAYKKYLLIEKLSLTMCVCVCVCFCLSHTHTHTNTHTHTHTHTYIYIKCSSYIIHFLCAYEFDTIL